MSNRTEYASSNAASAEGRSNAHRCTQAHSAHCEYQTLQLLYITRQCLTLI